MAKFVYRMQNILNIKYKLENQAKSEYAMANGILNQEQLKLEAIYDDINKCEEKIRELNSGEFNILEMRKCGEAVEYKKNQAELQKIVIERAQKRVERAREKLKEIMIERKTHEKLKEKAYDEFLEELSTQEDKEIDELVSFQFANRDEESNNET